MKTFLLLALLVCNFTSNATNYYFSTSSGDDLRTAVAAQNPATPWKTLSILTVYFKSINAGDSILLKRGERFYGSINVTKSGTLTAPIVIGAYGTGDKPVITSLITLTDWVAKGNGIWESYNPSFGSTANMVLVNGVAQAMGRYPDSDAANNGYLNYESHAGKTSITDNELSSAINWTGAELVTRPRHWILNKSLITSHSGNKISYQTTSPYDPYDNYGYFIQNSILTLDKPGEWFFNPSTKKLSVYFGTQPPSSSIISVAVIDDIIQTSNYSNIIFDNLAIEGANASAFLIYKGANIQIRNCTIRFSGKTAVLVHSHTNLKIENCLISHSNNNGIDLVYEVNNAIIRNNKIINSGLMAGMIENGEGSGLAIYSNGNGNSIEGNEIRNTGFIGITFYGNDAMIKNNFIDSFCYVKDDGGGIYTHGGATTTLGNKVIGNIIINGIGAGKGTDIADKRSVTGIYMDANTSNVEIRNNTVTTCDQGILLQSTTEMTVRNNTVYDNIKQFTMIQVDGNDLIRNNSITENILFSKHKEQWVSYIMSSADDIMLFGRFDSNYYARPIDDLINIYNYRQTTSGGVIENFELQGWKNKYNKDSSSKKTAKEIVPYKIDSLTGTNKFIKGGDFSLDIKGVSATSAILSHNTTGVLDGACLEVEPTARASSIYFKVGDVTAGKNYFLSYSIRGTGVSDMSLGATIKQSGPPFAVIAPSQSRIVNSLRREYEIVFSSSVSESSASVLLKADGLSKYYIDNIKFYEVNVSLTNVDDSLRFEYNAANVTKTVALNGSYIDAKGDVFINSLVLQPYSSAILIKTNNGVQNSAPAVFITSPADITSFASMAIINITATATDADGAIAKVEFFNDGNLLGTATAIPYTFTWSNVAAGYYFLTAKATDNSGLSTISGEVQIIVTDNSNPEVSVTFWPIDSTSTDDSTINLQAYAKGGDGSVTKVEFYDRETLLKTESINPYTCFWGDILPGKYVSTAIAYTDSVIKAYATPVSITASSPMPLSYDLSYKNTLNTQAVTDNNARLITKHQKNKYTVNAEAITITIGPNPASNILSVFTNKLPLDEKLELSIFSMHGSLLKTLVSNTSNKVIQLNVATLKQGIYLLKIKSGESIIYKQFEKL